MARSASARRADMKQRSAGLNQRIASIRKRRLENQAQVRDEMAILRLDLGAARKKLAGDVGVLRQTIRTEQAKTAADLHKHLSDALAKARGDMERQFAAARAVWPADAQAPNASVASGAAAAHRGAPVVEPVKGAGPNASMAAGAAAAHPAHGGAPVGDPAKGAVPRATMTLGAAPARGDAAVRIDRAVPCVDSVEFGMKGIAGD